MNKRNNEAMSTEDFLRQVVFNNGGKAGGGMDFRRSMGMPVADQAAQGRSTGWNEADHPRDDIGQFTEKEKGTIAGAPFSKEKPLRMQIPGEKVREARGVASLKSGNDTVGYYVIGNRPLDAPGGEIVYAGGSSAIEHRQFIKNNGTNFGLTVDGGGKAGKVEDSGKTLGRYTYHNGKRYRADCIEEARDEIDKEWMQELARRQQEPGTRLQGPQRVQNSMYNRMGLPGNPDRYSVGEYNCKHYVNAVLQRAEQIAKRKGVNLHVGQ